MSVNPSKKSSQNPKIKLSKPMGRFASDVPRPSQEAVKKYVKPDYRKRLVGGILILIGLMGCILTFPLLFLGTIIGFFTGIITKRNFFQFGVQGAKFGSLGALFILLFGVKLTNANLDRNKDTPGVPPSLKKEYPKPDAQVIIDSSAKHSTLEPSTLRPYKAINFKAPGEIEAFLKNVHELVIQDEAKVEKKKGQNVSNVSEEYIKRLMVITKNTTSSELDFWGELDAMTEKDIKSFVSQLGFHKVKGTHESSDLDYLWRHFKECEFEPSHREKKRKKFEAILEALSEEQLRASFVSADFLSIMNQEVYVEAAAHILNRNQLALFASNNQRHEILNKIIKKLKPEVYLLGKLVALIPYATENVRAALIEQLAHLSHPVSFKTKLTKCVEYYIMINKPVDTIPKTPDRGQPILSKTGALPPSKIIPQKTTSPILHPTLLGKKIGWADPAFEKFIHDFNEKTYIMNEKNIIDDLNTMPDDRIKMIVARACSREFKDLLIHLWVIESKPINHGSYIRCRKNRLKIILQNLSEAQLKDSIADNKFWDIFKNPQQPYCKMAARVLTPQQFKTIISNVELERHADFAKIMAYIKRNTLEEKIRFNAIIAAVIPYTSPWFVLALELKIKDLLKNDKSNYEVFSADLRKYLSKSMERKEVHLKYKKDINLNKKAISCLLHPHLGHKDPALGSLSKMSF